MEKEKKSLKSTTVKGIKPLKEELIRNGYKYTLHKRSKHVAMYKVSRLEDGKVVSYEVFTIRVRPPNRMVSIPYECMPSNQEFGMVQRSRAFYFNSKYQRALNYFDELNMKTEDYECNTTDR